MNENNRVQKSIKMTPLENAVYWVEEFLNNLGGDFKITELSKDQSVLTNTMSCSSYCGSGNSAPCDSIEKAINKAIKIYNNDLTANFIQCAENNSKGCSMIIALDSFNL